MTYGIILGVIALAIIGFVVIIACVVLFKCYINDYETPP